MYGQNCHDKSYLSNTGKLGTNTRCSLFNKKAFMLCERPSRKQIERIKEQQMSDLAGDFRGIWRPDAMDMALMAVENEERKRKTEIEFKRYAKYEVIKLEDIEKYLSPRQKRELSKIICTIQASRQIEGKQLCNSYVVVNEDQPYAEQVWALIKEQWEKDNTGE